MFSEGKVRMRMSPIIFDYIIEVTDRIAKE